MSTFYGRYPSSVTTSNNIWVPFGKVISYGKYERRGLKNKTILKHQPSNTFYPLKNSTCAFIIFTAFESHLLDKQLPNQVANTKAHKVFMKCWCKKDILQSTHMHLRILSWEFAIPASIPCQASTSESKSFRR